MQDQDKKIQSLNEILDTNQLSIFLGLSEATIYRKRKEGLPHYKDNKKCYYLKNEALEWFRDNQENNIRMTTEIKLDIDHIKELYVKQNMSSREIGKLLGVSKPTILDRLNKIGVTRPAVNLTNTTHGMKNTRLYRVWHGIKTRCLNSNDTSYSRYGGRGIEICDSWIDFENFMEWALKNGYSDDLEIDRIDNDGNYEPNNCRFTTIKENQNNKSTNRLITINNRTQTLTQWADEYGLSHEILSYRIKKRWSEEKLLMKTRSYRKRSD